MFTRMARLLPFSPTRSGSASGLWRLARTSDVLDAPTMVSRAKPFGASVGRAQRATMLVFRDVDSLVSYVLAPDNQTGLRVADDLAAAVGARAEKIDLDPDVEHSAMPDLTAAAVVGVVLARPSQSAGRDTQTNADPNEVARLLARSLRPGSWVAVTLRGYRRREANNVRRWYEHRLSGMRTHHVNETEAVVATFYAGGADADEVRSALSGVMAQLPGFDIDYRVRIVSSTALPVAGTSLASIAAWGGLGFVEHNWLAALATSGPLAALAAGLAFGVLPSRAARLRAGLDSGNLPRPRARTLPARRPRKESTNTQTGKTRAAHGGDYPLSRTSFFVAPSVIIGVASPHTGSGSGAAVTSVREPSPALLADIGPVIGSGGAGQRPVHISAAGLSAAIYGSKGAGKSVAVRVLFAWNCLERVSPSGKPGRPGPRNALVVFESKGQGAARYKQWADELGDRCLVMDANDPHTPAIDLFSVSGTARERASFFVEAMQYAFTDNSIQYQSKMTLTNVFTAALLVTPAIAAEAELAPGLSPVRYAHLLLSRTKTDGLRLSRALTQHAKTLGRDDPMYFEYAEMLGELSNLYGDGVTAGAQSKLTDAPVSKTTELEKLDAWFSGARPKVPWQQVLNEHWSLIVKTGGTGISQQLSSLLSSLLMYCLRFAIETTCADWGRTDRHVSIFSDELSMLAGTSPEVITWLHNQGREFGVSTVFATQYPDQLDPALRIALQTYSTVLWFKQKNPDIVDAAAREMSINGGTWTGGEIATLEQYHAALRADVDDQPQPAVPVRMGYWEDDPERFALDQGYPPPTRPHSAPVALDTSA